MHGRIYDMNQPGDPGVAHAILRLNGMAVVSDARGNYAFPAVPSGEYTLTVEPQSIGLHRVTAELMPLRVTVARGKSVTVNIAVMPAATLNGIVLVRPDAVVADDTPAIIGDPGKPQVTTPRGLGGILVELRHDDEVLRRVTDGAGAFLFEHLRPGHWEMTVYGDNLPAYHRLEVAEQSLMLSGEPTKVTVNVLPIARRIKMLNVPDNELSIGPIASIRTGDH